MGFEEWVVAHARMSSKPHPGAKLDDKLSSPGVFDHHWVEVIKTGEVTGKMATVLQELKKHIRDAQETRRKVVGALMYPAILIVVAVVAVTVMLWMVVPTFAKRFKDMGAELPDITQFVVNASNYVVPYGLYSAVGVIAEGAGSSTT